MNKSLFKEARKFIFFYFVDEDTTEVADESMNVHFFLIRQKRDNGKNDLRKFLIEILHTWKDERKDTLTPFKRVGDETFPFSFFFCVNNLFFVKHLQLRSMNSRSQPENIVFMLILCLPLFLELNDDSRCGNSCRNLMDIFTRCCV